MTHSTSSLYLFHIVRNFGAGEHEYLELRAEEKLTSFKSLLSQKLSFHAGNIICLISNIYKMILNITFI